MAERVAAETRANWKLPLLTVAASTAGFLLVIIYTAYFFVWIPFIATIVCLVWLILVVIAAILRQRRQIMSLMVAMAAFVAVAAVLDKGGESLRSYLRWFLWSRSFKAEVLAQPSPRAGELRHMEWEATGFASVAYTTSYLVFDPSDALEKVTRPGKVAGIPCEVPGVRRLEKHWYAVQFYTDEESGKCPWSSAARH